MAMLAACAVLAALTAGCSKPVESLSLPPPAHVESYCRNAVDGRALRAVLRSLQETSYIETSWAISTIKARLHEYGGAIADWNDLALPFAHVIPPDGHNPTVHAKRIAIVDGSDAYGRLAFVYYDERKSGRTSYHWHRFNVADEEHVCS